MVGAPLKTSTVPTPPPAAKPKLSTPTREAGSSPRRPGRPATFIRVALTIWILWHFTGVFLAALSVNVTSDLVLHVSQNAHGPMQWYLDALYMNQGHSFFAPDVGPGHLIKYELFDQTNHLIEQGEFPSRKEHWPRLLYHRYFMLADQSELAFDEKGNDRWQRLFLEAYGRQLLRAHDQAQSIRLRRYAHWPLPMSYVSGSLKNIQRDIDQLTEQRRTLEADELSRNAVKEAMIRGYSFFKNDMARRSQNSRMDDQGYEVLAEAIQRRSDLEPEANKQTINWQNFRQNTASRPWGTPR